MASKYSLRSLKGADPKPTNHNSRVRRTKKERVLRADLRRVANFGLSAVLKALRSQKRINRILAA